MTNTKRCMLPWCKIYKKLMGKVLTLKWWSIKIIIYFNYNQISKRHINSSKIHLKIIHFYHLIHNQTQTWQTQMIKTYSLMPKWISYSHLYRRSNRKINLEHSKTTLTRAKNTTQLTWTLATSTKAMNTIQLSWMSTLSNIHRNWTPI